MLLETCNQTSHKTLLKNHGKTSLTSLDDYTADRVHLEETQTYQLLIIYAVHIRCTVLYKFLVFTHHAITSGLSQWSNKLCCWELKGLFFLTAECRYLEKGISPMAVFDHSLDPLVLCVSGTGLTLSSMQQGHISLPTHLTIWTSLKNGGIFQLNHSPFGRIPVDHTIQKTANKETDWRRGLVPDERFPYHSLLNSKIPVWDNWDMLQYSNFKLRHGKLEIFSYLSGRSRYWSLAEHDLIQQILTRLSQSVQGSANLVTCQQFTMSTFNRRASTSWFFK